MSHMAIIGPSFFCLLKSWDKGQRYIHWKPRSVRWGLGLDFRVQGLARTLKP